MSELSLECNTCHESSPLSTSKSVTQRGTSYDINRRAVYHAIETGSGYEGLAAFCSIMNMPCLTKAAYYKQVENILEALENEANEEMRNAAERLRQHILDENPEKDEQDEVFEEWLLEYECDINFAGSSPAMESEGASVLWGRSIDHHNLRYKWIVCDGDSKAFNSVEHVYGETKVEKLGNCEEELPKKPVGRLLANCRPTNGRQSANCRPTGFAQNIGYLSADCRTTVGNVLVTCR